MFWKNTAWSWDDAAGGDDDDDGGYLLAAELRRTPDSTPDSDLNHVTDATSTSAVILTKSTSTSSTAPKDLSASPEPTNASYSGCVSPLYANTNQRHTSRDRDGSCAQRMTVSQCTR